MEKKGKKEGRRRDYPSIFQTEVKTIEKRRFNRM
jgi:hypothetical protein